MSYTIFNKEINKIDRLNFEQKQLSLKNDIITMLKENNSQL